MKTSAVLFINPILHRISGVFNYWYFIVNCLYGWTPVCKRANHHDKTGNQNNKKQDALIEF